MCISGLTIRHPVVYGRIASATDSGNAAAAGCRFPGAPARHDFEYERCGVCNVFMAVEPLASKRTVQIRERRTKTDWAHFLNELQQLTHVGSLYETFEMALIVSNS